MAVQLPESDPKNVLQDCLFLAKAYATMRLKDSSYYFIKVAATIAARRPFSDAAANAAVFSVIGELYLVHGEAAEAERMCVLCRLPVSTRIRVIRVIRVIWYYTWPMHVVEIHASHSRYSRY
jgi:hypothetical protein